VPRELPSFDLVVATVGRDEELGRLFESLRAQTHRDFRVIVVDQNVDDRITHLLDGHGLEIVHVRAQPGLSHARNAALRLLEADVVAFPDDDCAYPVDLLERVATRLAREADLDGLTGRAADATGRSSSSWNTDAAMLTDDNLWNRAISFTIFLRRGVVERVGTFDEHLGLGSRAPWGSGEEIDYLIRAVRGGARIAYDPSLTVVHEVREDDAKTGYRDGASVGYLLRKHGYPVRTRARMLVRPVGGGLVALGRGDGARARYYAATFRGRVRGLWGRATT
jgi:glycosyltransferase involved in cell wall biosynthesis